MKRQRKKKHDRLTSGAASENELKVDYAIGPFDQRSREMDLKWGVDRLPDLVSPETAQIWAQTMANLNGAIAASYTAEDQDQARADVIACVNSCLKGFEFMDAEAEAAGKPKADTRIFQYQANGTKFAIMADGDAWPAVKNENPDLVIYTPDEVANALEAYNSADQFLEETRKHFPDAKLTITSKPDYASGGDPINF